MFRPSLSVRHSLLKGTAMALTLAAPIAASADVIDPAEEACSGKTEGTACSAGDMTGTCKPGECCKLDYSNGTPPTSKCSPCQICKEGGAATDVSDSDTAPTSDNTTSIGSDSGCSVGGQQLPPWTLPGLALGAVTLLWLRRRPASK
jgi:MYXO-CTERM domain-containing protein